MKEYDEIQKELHASEPEYYTVLVVPGMREFEIGARKIYIGFNAEKSGADGYCDHRGMWVSDHISDPHWFIEVCIHESLHAIFPELSEADVEKYAHQIATVVVRLYEFKSMSNFPPLKRIGNKSTMLPAMREWFEKNVLEAQKSEKEGHVDLPTGYSPGSRAEIIPSIENCTTPTTADCGFKPTFPLT